MRRGNKEEHEKDIYFCIQNGKNLKIKMKGKTLSSIQGKVVIQSPRIVLPTLPVGLTAQVIIPVWMQNIGINSLKYAIDKEKFKREHASDWGNGVVELDGSEGTIQAGERRFFSLYFRPREAREHSFSLLLRASDYFKEVQALEIGFTGKAVKELVAAEQGNYFKSDDQIESGKEDLAGGESVAYLSEEQIDFRNADFGRPHQRLLFLFNNSASESFSFSFEPFHTSKFGHQSRYTDCLAGQGGTGPQRQNPACLHFGTEGPS